MQEKKKKRGISQHPGDLHKTRSRSRDCLTEEGRKPSGLGVHSTPPGSALAHHPNQLQTDADLEPEPHLFTSTSQHILHEYSHFQTRHAADR